MKNHIKNLSQIGLTEKEAEIYIALLKLGEASVQQIAEEANIKRPTTYVVLEELRQKEIILKLPQSKRTLYVPKPPKEVVEQAFARVSEVSNSLPELNALRKKDERVNTLYFDGVKGIKEAMNYKINEIQDSELVGFWAKTDLVDRDVVDYCHTWLKKSAKNNNTIRAVAPNHDSLKEFRDVDADVGATVKRLKNNMYSSNASIEATNQFVRIILFNTPQAIIIESPELVKTVREIFEMVWDKQK